MAPMEQAALQRQGKSFARQKKTNIRIDMTPMVDLGFLLITFFVFTTNLSEPMSLKLNMPSDETDTDPSQLPNSLALSVLPGSNNKIYYYHGDWEEAKKNNAIFTTGYSVYSGLGSVIRQKQKAIDASGKFPEGRNGLMLLIKPGEKSTYRNLIDILDEIMINDVKKYAIVELVSEEIN